MRQKTARWKVGGERFLKRIYGLSAHGDSEHRKTESENVISHITTLYTYMRLGATKDPHGIF